jgi:hypothetical protein
LLFMFKKVLIIFFLVLITLNASAIFFDTTNLFIIDKNKVVNVTDINQTNDFNWSKLNQVVPWQDINLANLSWVKLQNYPVPCPVGQAVNTLGDVPTCIPVGGSSDFNESDANNLYVQKNPLANQTITSFNLNLDQNLIIGNTAKLWAVPDDNIFFISNSINDDTTFGLGIASNESALNSSRLTSLFLSNQLGFGVADANLVEPEKVSFSVFPLIALSDLNVSGNIKGNQNIHADGRLSSILLDNNKLVWNSDLGLDSTDIGVDFNQTTQIKKYFVGCSLAPDLVPFDISKWTLCEDLNDLSFTNVNFGSIGDTNFAIMDVHYLRIRDTHDQNNVGVIPFIAVADWNTNASLVNGGIITGSFNIQNTGGGNINAAIGITNNISATNENNKGHINRATGAIFSVNSNTVDDIDYSTGLQIFSYGSNSTGISLNSIGSKDTKGLWIQSSTDFNGDSSKAWGIFEDQTDLNNVLGKLYITKNLTIFGDENNSFNTYQKNGTGFAGSSPITIANRVAFPDALLDINNLSVDGSEFIYDQFIGIGDPIGLFAFVDSSTNELTGFEHFPLGNRFSFISDNLKTVWDFSGTIVLSGVHEDVNALRFCFEDTGDCLSSNTTSPTINVGTGAGTAPSVSIAGTDKAGEVIVTTGLVTAGAGATIVSVTYQLPYQNDSYVTLTPANAATALLSGATGTFVDANAFGFSIDAGATALAVTTTYKWNYMANGD